MVTDSFHNKKLKEYGINIKTKYIVGNKILERNTDNSINDDINNGVRCEKQYYHNNKLIHKEKLFDTRIEYTFISKDVEDTPHKCDNCGMEGKLKDFIKCCPYCRTDYNIDYSDKDLGSKHHYDRVLKSNTYRIITAVIDLIISTIIMFFYIQASSRTFNSYDIAKVFIYGFILALALYYLFYLLDAYVILGPIKRYKDRQNKKQIEFWKRTGIDKKHFFNNLNYEVRKEYYEQQNIIDYDVIDYIEFNDFKKKDKLCVEVIAEARIVYFINGKIKSEMKKEKYVMMKHDNQIQNLQKGANHIECYNCGASIDVTQEECGYCQKKQRYLHEWIMIED